MHNASFDRTLGKWINECRIIVLSNSAIATNTERAGEEKEKTNTELQVWKDIPVSKKHHRNSAVPRRQCFYFCVSFFAIIVHRIDNIQQVKRLMSIKNETRRCRERKKMHILKPTCKKRYECVCVCVRQRVCTKRFIWVLCLIIFYV